MESTINAVFTVLGILIAGSAIAPIYKAVKTETVLRVHGAMHTHLEGFTRKLTGAHSTAHLEKPKHMK